jgi:hypothetical protein
MLQHMYEMQVASGIAGAFKPVIERPVHSCSPEIILGLIMGGSRDLLVHRRLDARPS